MGSLRVFHPDPGTGPSVDRGRKTLSRDVVDGRFVGRGKVTRSPVPTVTASGPLNAVGPSHVVVPRRSILEVEVVRSREGRSLNTSVSLGQQKKGKGRREEEVLFIQSVATPVRPDVTVLFLQGEQGDGGRGRQSPTTNNQSSV